VAIVGVSCYNVGPGNFDELRYDLVFVQSNMMILGMRLLQDSERLLNLCKLLHFRNQLRHAEWL
jgi:hypothetical protein